MATGRYTFANIFRYRFHTNVTHQVDKKPMLCIDNFRIEKKGSAYETLIEKIGRESRKPHEHVKAGTGLKHEKGNRLLNEQADHDCVPLDMRPVLGSRPKAELEHGQTQDGDCTVAIFRTLVRPMRISGRF